MSFSIVRRAILAISLMATLTRATHPLDRFESVGCHKEPFDGSRALSEKTHISETMTTESCYSICKDYKFFGTERGSEYYCGNAISSLATRNAVECKTPCKGNGNEACGSSSHISIYRYKDYVQASAVTVPGAAYVGCALDNTSARVLAEKRQDSDKMTPAKCLSICSGYSYFGIEHSRECYCGNKKPVTFDSKYSCNTPCSGDKSALCGGPSHLTVYQPKLARRGTESIEPSIGVVPSAAHIGCAPDSSQRVMNEKQVTDDPTMTPQKCSSSCESYKYFGVEGGNQCYCSNTKPTSFVDNMNCNEACSGNPSELCGGFYLLNVYERVPSAVTVTATNTVCPTVRPACPVYHPANARGPYRMED